MRPSSINQKRMSERITGIFVPPIVPLDERGDVNELEFRRFLNWLIASGVHGIYANGSTGEFTRFSPEERRRIVHIVCEEARGKVPVIAGAGEANVRETLAACSAYQSLGARAIAVVSPFYFKLSQEAIYSYYKSLADESPIDLFLYNIPAFASPMELQTICRLAELPRIIGIKDSSADLAFMMRLLAAIRPMRADFSLFTGAEAILLPMLMMGADGGTHSIVNVVPEIMRQLFDLSIAKKLEEAKAIQFQILKLLDAMLNVVEFPEGFRAGVELRGFKMGIGRQPKAVGQKTDRAKLRSLIETITAGEIDE